MKTNRILMLTAMAAMAIVMVSCTPDEPVVPVTDGDVIIAEQNGLQLEGTVWHAIVESDIHVHSMSYHFVDDETLSFLTADRGCRYHKAIIVGGYPAEEVYGEDYEGFTHEFQYNVIDNIVFAEYSGEVQDSYSYNPTNNTLVAYWGDENGEPNKRVVFHQVEPERE